MNDRMPEPVAVPGWKSPRGYSDAMIARGRLVSIAGQIGWDPATGEFGSDDLAAQTAQTLRNVAAALAACGAEPRHVIRLTWYVTDRDAYLASRSTIGEAYRAVFGQHYPPMALIIVAGLVESRAMVEIEATAVLPDDDHDAR
jgi:enamine deaminase RidA (YjgF/YER057c/UK114 family)